MTLTSEHFMLGAKITLVLLLLVQAAQVWMATRDYCDKMSRVRAIAKIRRESLNRNRQAAWLFCTLAADGFFDTRKITDREWMLAANGIERELGR